MFLDQATNNVVRLKTGQDHDGWVLRAVKGREATLHKNGKSEILALPVPGRRHPGRRAERRAAPAGAAAACRTICGRAAAAAACPPPCRCRVADSACRAGRSPSYKRRSIPFSRQYRDIP